MTDPFSAEPRPVASRSQLRQASADIQVGVGELVVVTSVRIPFGDVMRIVWQVFFAWLAVGAVVGVLYVIVEEACFR